MALRSLFTVLVLVSMAGCGGDTAGADDPGGDAGTSPEQDSGTPIPAFCTESCELKAELDCPNDDTELCIRECSRDAERFTACADPQEAAAQCLIDNGSEALECNEYGEALVRAGSTLCSAERMALGDCYSRFVD